MTVYKNSESINSTRSYWRKMKCKGKMKEKTLERTQETGGIGSYCHAASSQTTFQVKETHQGISAEEPDMREVRDRSLGRLLCRKPGRSAKPELRQ